MFKINRSEIEKIVGKNVVELLHRQDVIENHNGAMDEEYVQKLSTRDVNGTETIIYAGLNVRMFGDGTTISPRHDDIVLADAYYIEHGLPAADAMKHIELALK